MDTLQSHTGLFELQRRNMAALLAFDALRRADRLTDAERAGAELSASLERQAEWTQALNRVAPAGSQPLDLPTSARIDVLLQRADVAESLARPPAQAVELRQRALALAQQLGGIEVAERGRQLAGSQLEKGRFNEALANLIVARDLFVAAGARVSAARCTADLANAYEWLYDFDRALAEVERAYELLGVGRDGEALPDAQAIADMLPGLLEDDDTAGSLRTMKELEQQVLQESVRCDLLQVEARSLMAKRSFDRAPALLEQARPMIPPYARAGIDVQLIKIALETRRYGDALEAILELEPQFEQGALRRKYGVLLTMKARGFHEAGHSGHALSVVRQAFDALDGFDDPEAESKAFECAGDILAALGDADAALGMYSRAAERVDWLCRAPLGHRLDSLRLASRKTLFRHAIALAATAGDARTCCRLIEMLKSRQLAATLAVPGGGGDATETTRRIDALNEQLAGVGYAGGSDVPVADLVAERNALLERVRIEEPRWRTLTEALPIDPDAWCERLGQRRQAALTLHLDGERLTAVLLRGDGCRVAARTLDAATTASIEAVQRALAAGTPHDAIASGLRIDALLPHELIAPALVEPTLVVVPHGPLHLLPWPQLALDGEPLFRRLAVTVLPNLSGFGDAPEPTPAAAVALVGASPEQRGAIGAAEECGQIARLYRDNGRGVAALHVERDATRSAFLALLHGAERPGVVLHVACHGDFDLADPMSSSLALADGRVDAASIARGRLAFDEVVLSACSTGQRALRLGDIELGDEIVGLAGAFLEAGARSVLVSLTPTADHASLELVRRYHDGRIAGLAPGAALRSAQLALADDGVFPPAQWGGFMVFGRD